ncbi:MAG: hypothetical protein AB1772_03855 [Candidatus Zixiibacteriota bacterium]
MKSNWRITRIVFLPALLCIAWWSSSRASISLSQSIDRTDMAYEDTASFQVVVTWAGGVSAYRFEQAFRLNSDKLKVARFTSSVRSTGNGANESTTKTFDYKLVPFLSGVARVDPMVIEYVTWPDSSAGQLVTDAVTLAIAEPLPAGERRKGGLDGGWFALIAAAVVGLGIGSYALFKPKPVKETAKSPALAFLEQLDEVRKEAGMDLKRFQTGLYRSLGNYVHSRYGINVTGRPASAAAAELEKVEPDTGVRSAIAGWLARAEREKFSPVEPAPGEVSRLESEIRVFFEKLK